VITPATAAVPGPCTANVVLLMVAGFIAPSKVAVTVELGHVVSELLTGLTEIIVGGITTELLVAQQPAKRRIAPNPRT